MHSILNFVLAVLVSDEIFIFLCVDEEDFRDFSVCHLLFVICYLLFVICLLSFVFCRLLAVNWKRPCLSLSSASIFMPLPPLPLLFWSSNSYSSYPTDQDKSRHSLSYPYYHHHLPTDRLLNLVDATENNGNENEFEKYVRRELKGRRGEEKWKRIWDRRCIIQQNEPGRRI